MNVSCLHLPLPALSTPMGCPSPSVCIQSTDFSTGLTTHSQHQNSMATTYDNYTMKQQLEGPHIPGSFRMGSSSCTPDQVYLIPEFFSVRIKRCMRVCLLTPNPGGYWCGAIQREVRGRAAHLIKAKKYWELKKKKVCTHLIFKIFLSNRTMTQAHFHSMQNNLLKCDTI